MESRALRISIVAAGIILAIIILIVVLLSKKPTTSGTKIITPTPIESNYQNNGSQKSNTTNNNQGENSKTSGETDIYYENSDFTVSYNPTTSNYTIDQKNSQAGEKITEWLAQHPELGQNVTIKEDLLTLQTDSNINQLSSNEAGIDKNHLLKEGLEQILKTAKIITNGKVYTIPNPYNSLEITPSPTNPLNQINHSSNFIYYPQCNGPYDNYSLPSGCNICTAGCGPTTVAMIVASYADAKVKPPTVVDKYKEKNQPLSCAGSGFSSAKMVLESYGLRTSDYLFSYGLYPIEDVASDFKSYLNSGWTIFALANFKASGGGHYFWITDIDSDNTVWAYDPYYGRFQAPPLNENSRYPFPKYKIAFAVKKAN